jgi:hypothetical protein
MYVTLEPDPIHSPSSYSSFVCNLSEPIVLTNPHELALSEFFYTVDYVCEVGTVIFTKIKDNTLMSKQVQFEQLYKLLYTEVTIAQTSQQVNSRADVALAELDTHSQNYFSEIENRISTDCYDSFVKFHKEESKKFDSIDHNYQSRIYAIFDTLKVQFTKCLFKTATETKIFLKDRTKNPLINLLPFCSNNKVDANYECQIVKSNFLFLKNNHFSFKSNKFVSNFFIFTDIISENRVLNSNQPILKIIKPEGEVDEYIEKLYERPHYHPCSKTFINKISIQIKDGSGDLVQFGSGPLILKLHFRKIKR